MCELRVCGGYVWSCERKKSLFIRVAVHLVGSWAQLLPDSQLYLDSLCFHIGKLTQPLTFLGARHLRYSASLRPISAVLDMPWLPLFFSWRDRSSMCWFDIDLTFLFWYPCYLSRKYLAMNIQCRTDLKVRAAQTCADIVPNLNTLSYPKPIICLAVDVFWCSGAESLGKHRVFSCDFHHFYTKTPRFCTQLHATLTSTQPGKSYWESCGYWSQKRHRINFVAMLLGSVCRTNRIRNSVRNFLVVKIKIKNNVIVTLRFPHDIHIITRSAVSRRFYHFRRGRVFCNFPLITYSAWK